MRRACLRTCFHLRLGELARFADDGEEAVEDLLVGKLALVAAAGVIRGY